jgi:hypothetical protein
LRSCDAYWHPRYIRDFASLFFSFFFTFFFRSFFTSSPCLLRQVLPPTLSSCLLSGRPIPYRRICAAPSNDASIATSVLSRVIGGAAGCYPAMQTVNLQVKHGTAAESSPGAGEKPFLVWRGADRVFR